jgi:preprotein translocase subunit SecD
LTVEEVPMIARRLGWVAGGLAAAVFVLAATVARAGDEPKDLDKIPKAVMDALKAKFPKAKIDKWTKETEDGKVIYDLEFKEDGRKAEADIAEDGTIQNFEKEFDAKDLPKAVTDAVEQKYPKSKMKEIMEITEIKDKKEVHGGFEIVLETADKKEVEVTVAKDGKILEDSGAKKEEKK